MDFSFRLDHLQDKLANDAARYAAASPFPHVELDDFLRPDVLAQAIAEFPKPEAIRDWRRLTDKDDQGRPAVLQKLGYSNELEFGPALRRLVYELNSSHFLRYLERLTGIPNLIPDPHMAGGGLHQYLPGAVLRVHADFNRLPSWNLDRRLNLLLYLNPEWRPEWGGALELWDEAMSSCVRSIQPVANRCVVFSTTSTSHHGIPDPIACPEGVTRRSLALYYYSNGRPEHERTPRHSTLWQARPHER